MRAPPEAVNMMKGVRFATACSHAGDDRLARRHAERTAEKIEILNARSMIADPSMLAGGEPDRIVRAGLEPVFLETIGVALHVAEFQRIQRHLRVGIVVIGAGSNSAVEPRLDRHAMW